MARETLRGALPFVMGEALRNELAGRINDLLPYNLDALKKNGRLDPEFDKYLQDRFGDKKGEVLKRLEAGKIQELVNVAGGFLKAKFLSENPGIGEENVEKLFHWMWDEHMIAKDKTHTRYVQLAEKKDRTADEDMEMADLALKNLEAGHHRKFFATAMVFVGSKEMRDAFVRETQPKIEAGELPTSPGEVMSLAIFLAGSEMNRREFAEPLAWPSDREAADKRPGSPEDNLANARDVQLTPDEVKDKCGGIDLSLLLEQGGVDPNTPEGERIMQEILDNPTTHYAVSNPSGFSRLLIEDVTFNKIGENMPKDKAA